MALLCQALGEVAIPALGASHGAREQAVVYEADVHRVGECHRRGAPRGMNATLSGTPGGMNATLSGTPGGMNATPGERDTGLPGGTPSERDTRLAERRHRLR